MRNKLYFLVHGETCLTREQVIEHAREGQREILVHHAVVSREDPFMFCKVAGEVGEKGHCGNQCQDYFPRNKNSGMCLNQGPVYEKGKLVILKV